MILGTRMGRLLARGYSVGRGCCAPDEYVEHRGQCILPNDPMLGEQWGWFAVNGVT